METKENMIRTSIYIAKEHVEKLQELRAQEKPIPTLSELIRRAIELFLGDKK